MKKPSIFPSKLSMVEEDVQKELSVGRARWSLETTEVCILLLRLE
jgi:hypothetical protein